MALGYLYQFLMKNEICFIINYFNLEFSIVAFFASILDGQGIIVKIIDSDKIFISHRRSHICRGDGRVDTAPLKGSGGACLAP
jgi:hypothetical protein